MGHGSRSGHFPGGMGVVYAFNSTVDGYDGPTRVFDGAIFGPRRSASFFVDRRAAVASINHSTGTYRYCRIGLFNIEYRGQILPYHYCETYVRSDKPSPCLCAIDYHCR